MIPLSKRFSDRVNSLFASQQNRAKEKRGPSGRISKVGYVLPFNKQQFIAWLVDKFGGETGVIRCRYCNRPIDAYSCAIDHAIPLKRSGSPGLENLEAICDVCNPIKGQLVPEEFSWFLDKMAEMSARFPGSKCVSDVMSRLGKAVKLAASVRWSRAQKAKQQVPAAVDDDNF